MYIRFTFTSHCSIKKNVQYIAFAYVIDTIVKYNSHYIRLRISNMNILCALHETWLNMMLFHSVFLSNSFSERSWSWSRTNCIFSVQLCVVFFFFPFIFLYLLFSLFVSYKNWNRELLWSMRAIKWKKKCAQIIAQNIHAETNIPDLFFFLFWFGNFLCNSKRISIQIYAF